MKQTSAQSASIYVEIPSAQQQQQEEDTIITVASNETKSAPRDRPCPDLLNGPDYNTKCVPLYKASITSDWKAAKAIFDEHREYVGYSITERGNTALHIVASAKRNKKVETFLKNLVDLMEKNELELKNYHGFTALYIAAGTGTVAMVKSMVEKNRNLLTITSDSKGLRLPVCVAALSGNYEVVKYLYEESRFTDTEFTSPQISELFQRCVEADMFDIAQRMVQDVGEKKILEALEVSGTRKMLEALACKPDAFFRKKSDVIWRPIKFGFSLIGLKVRFPEKESEALQLFIKIWGEIAKKSKAEIDDILGAGGTSHLKSNNPTTTRYQKPDSGNVDQVVQLQKLISEHIGNMNVETHYIMKGQQASAKEDQALKLQELIFEHTTKMLVKSQNIIREPVATISSNQNGNADQVSQQTKPISEHIVSGQQAASGKEDEALKLQELVPEHAAKTHVVSQNYRNPAGRISSSHVMLIATERGNTEFVIELIRQYHDLINKKDENRQSIFHVAVRHRREGIYNLIYEIGAVKEMFTPCTDQDGNNMLHLAGLLAHKSRLQDMSGAALQMQRELLWFKEVESMMRPAYRERKNKAGLTPHELFTKEHADLITEGEKWMKETANQCMVVAALIATIVFAAAFTVPGGYNQDDGIPIYYRERNFKVFVVADAISLFLSSASILTFLSILTSRYAERDFVESLPKKLMLGLATLFLSITTMMIAFSISFFVLYHNEVKWISILIGAFAFLPVLLYVALQYHMLVDVFRSTYGSKYLFKPAKEVLFCGNPTD